jgi:putative restriction endonuclease
MATFPAETQRELRADAFRWLDERFVQQGRYELSHIELKSYRFPGMRGGLIDTGRGIRNPEVLDATLSILTSWNTITKSLRSAVYADAIGDDGWVTYSFQSEDGGDNVKLLRAFEQQEPLIYFHAVSSGVYGASYPIFIERADSHGVGFRLAESSELASLVADPLVPMEQFRRYAQRTVNQRLHQPMFRAHVLHAYRARCAVCRLAEAKLVDAAHIVPDTHERGVAHVSNGMAMCKLHHAAYDRQVLGITADYKVQVADRLRGLREDSMLQKTLVEMHGRRLTVPDGRGEQPNRDALAYRYAEFLAAAG